MYRMNYEQVDHDYSYIGNDLGVTIYEDKTVFKTWSPFATAVYLNLYLDGEGDNLIERLPMELREKGVWCVELFHDCDGVFYTYTFEFNYKERYETIDIYAKACGVNGNRGAVVDFSTTNPYGWDKVKRPKCKSPCDAVIYECHVRDFSADETSGIIPEHRGKFLGFCEPMTKCDGEPTCFDHLKDLGITHVQLLPVADYATVDESKLGLNEYNWGYDSQNFNCLEGSYSTNPFDPKCRIREFKQLVMNLHKNGIGVIMDVVFNHTYYTEESAFEKTFPYYYHRVWQDGTFSNGSGCGNETASNHFMMRKYMIDSLKFWVTEYKIDGFRFDLMALHDIETINIIRDELNKIDPQILMYGEGWTGGESPMPADKLAYKWNSYQFCRVGLFNDNIRDSIKGGTFNLFDKGFISGNRNAWATLRRGIAGSVKHPQLNEANEACWAFEPTQAINYCEAHDNNTLWDKLTISTKYITNTEIRIQMDKLAAAIVFLSQGVPFIQLAQDFLRSKPNIPPENGELDDVSKYSHNSYNSSDFTNKVIWSKKKKYYEVFAYYKALIKLRKSSGLFRMTTKEEVAEHLRFIDTGDCNFIEFILSDKNECFVVVLNPYWEDRRFNLPEGRFYQRLDKNGKMNKFAVSGNVVCPAVSAVVYKKIKEK
ncbi:MAG: type I pullulanase [Hominimerdicola sp.]